MTDLAIAISSRHQFHDHVTRSAYRHNVSLILPVKSSLESSRDHALLIECPDNGDPGELCAGQMMA